MGTDAVDGYLAGLAGPWPRDGARAVVAAIRDAGPFDEAIRWGHPCFALDGAAVVKIFTARDWINVCFFRGVELADPDGLLETEERARMRKLRVERGGAVPAGLTGLTRSARDLVRPC